MVMKSTQQFSQQAQALFTQAKQALANDMEARNIGAILWNNATAGFHYIPAVVVRNGDKAKVVRIMGLYRYDGEVYLIEEDKAGVDINNFYNEDTEVPPVVVTLTESVAEGDLGNPTERPGFTTQGSLEEWTAIADCYFEALNEDQDN